MAFKHLHPSFIKMNPLWRLGIDSYEGEHAIKAAGATYLPPTSGQVVDGCGTDDASEGAKAYKAYKLRSYYPDLFKEAVEATIGVMHRKPPVIELPPKLAAMVEDSTKDGAPLSELLRRINAQQLVTGRVGVLGDWITEPGEKPKPIINLYNDVTIPTWGTGIVHGEESVQVVVLDESGTSLGPNLEWEHKETYKLLVLTDKNTEGALVEPSGTYGFADVDKDVELSRVTATFPNIYGSESDEIPFSFVNTKDTVSAPDYPPFLGLANLCLAIYRGEADYRQNLFMQGQDTLVRTGHNEQAGEDNRQRLGAGAVIDVPINGKAEFIGVSSTGISEQRTCLENDYKRAEQKGAQLVDATSRSKESGDALKIRVAAKTATLPQIAKAGAAGLEKVLRVMAKWAGDDPLKVVVTPNLDFNNQEIDSTTLTELAKAKMAGAPISDEAIHAWMVENNFTKFTFEEEIARLQSEEPRI